jgi:flavin reductase (DIM6/NTAB) family NADH-FMN oxidoreductase RutF
MASRLFPLRGGRLGEIENPTPSQLPSTTPSPRLTTMPLPPQTPASTDLDGFAAALGRIPSGLFIVSWRAADADRGMLASWVMQSGFEPPLVSVAVGTSRDLLAVVRAGGPFAVNVLAESQRSLLARFGKPPADGEDPFAGLAITRTPSGIAALAEAAGWMECRPVAEAAAAGADHVVVLGQIEAAGGRPDAPPLVHLRRNGLKY